MTMHLPWPLLLALLAQLSIRAKPYSTVAQDM
ncbi:hypothetical protein CIPAW_04G115700 [Carya illinoinensis]|uniref:Uncharacterized protein n=1 Tax=Carya illinoinensis TaxID=32201 RepID=A0A8T1QTP1_CARIL|nr:hypothetical protein CIPAW_04G115700 [Carya illinoinensis]